MLGSIPPTFPSATHLPRFASLKSVAGAFRQGAPELEHGVEVVQLPSIALRRYWQRGCPIESLHRLISQRWCPSASSFSLPTRSPLSHPLRTEQYQPPHPYQVCQYAVLRLSLPHVATLFHPPRTEQYQLLHLYQVYQRTPISASYGLVHLPSLHNTIRRARAPFFPLAIALRVCGAFRNSAMPHCLYPAADLPHGPKCR